MADDPNADKGAKPGGENPPPNTPPASPPTDLEAVKAEAAANALAGFNEQLKGIAGVDSLDALKAQAEQAEAKALEDQGKYRELAEAAQKKADAAEAKAAESQTLLNQERAKVAIVGAASQAGAIDVGLVHTLLGGAASVDQDGTVTIGGKPPGEAVKALLEEKPYLAAASGKQGSGAGASGGDSHESKLADAKKAGNVGEVLKLQRTAGGN
ncbi:MAG: hypothetical protein U9Q81_00950 [Pseudomonadota bacterium]|nr:hypothetical protein [Pseudomonadota bacterium]